jgi:hypothetical protein
VRPGSRVSDDAVADVEIAHAVIILW